MSRLLEKFGQIQCYLMDPNVKLVKDDKHSKRVNPRQYQSMVGSLLHAARATRPDIAHAVGIVTKQQVKSCWVIQMQIGPMI